MKPSSVKTKFLVMTILCFVGSILGSSLLVLNSKSEYVSVNNTFEDGNLALNTEIVTNKMDLDIVTLPSMNVASGKSLKEIQKEKKEAERKKIVYDGMNIDELSLKLNRILHSSLSGQGYTFASKCIKYGVDPYLAVAIAMHETGCEGTCSSLMQRCNNVGGMKGGSGVYCDGGSYARFSSLEAGIDAFVSNLSRNYFSMGLTTPEAIGPKYAASPTWSMRVNAYINKIKAV